MIYQAWMAQADSDLAAAKILSTSNFHSHAIWFSSQAIEKGHKAILLALGIQYQDSHFKKLGHETAEIAQLIPLSLQTPLNAEIGKVLSTLQTKGLESRYPAPRQVTGSKDSRVVAPHEHFQNSAQEIADAELVLNWCRERITRALNAVAAMMPQQ